MPRNPNKVPMLRTAVYFRLLPNVPSCMSSQDANYGNCCPGTCGAAISSGGSCANGFGPGGCDAVPSAECGGIGGIVKFSGGQMSTALPSIASGSGGTTVAGDATKKKKKKSDQLTCWLWTLHWLGFAEDSVTNDLLRSKTLVFFASFPGKLRK
jgi:hypothetical protein